MSSTINSALEEAVTSGRFLGISYIAIDKNGNSIYRRAHGHADFAKTRPMTLSTGGWLASMTKLVTSVAVMQAVERELIGLDDDIGQILPELGEQKILVSFDEETGRSEWGERKEPLTLRRLLSHSSGLAYPRQSETLERWSVAKNRQMGPFTGNWKTDFDRPPIAQPGSSWNYGTGIDWAGKVVAKLSGKSLEEHMQENIFKPCGMANMTFHPEKRDRFDMLAMGTRSAEDPDRLLIPCANPWPTPAEEAGGAGLYSTAEDYAKLLAALLSDKSPVLSKESLEEFVRPQLTSESRVALKAARDRGMVFTEIPRHVSVDHSLGGLYMDTDVEGRRPRGAICWDGLSSSNWLLDRVTGVAVVLFVQVMTVDPETKKLWWELEKEVYKLVAEKAA